MSTEKGGADPKAQSTLTTGDNQLKPPLLKPTATLLTSASSPAIAANSLKDDKKMQAPKGLTNSSSATSLVSYWIFAPLERLNHTTADFEIYAGSPPDNSESPHHFGGYNLDQQENRKLRDLSISKQMFQPRQVRQGKTAIQLSLVSNGIS